MEKVVEGKETGKEFNEGVKRKSCNEVSLESSMSVLERCP